MAHGGRTPASEQDTARAESRLRKIAVDPDLGEGHNGCCAIAPQPVRHRRTRLPHPDDKCPPQPLSAGTRHAWSQQTASIAGGCPMRHGERVLLPFPSGNRDPDAIEHPDQVFLGRAMNRLFAFGVGVHPCLGSNLTPMEQRVTETWLKHLPELTLSDLAAVTWPAGQVRGPRTLPVAAFPPPRTGR